MSPVANARTARCLDELGTALQRFGGEALRALDEAARDGRRTLDWLQARRRHWQNQVRCQQDAVARAHATLGVSRGSVYYDPQTGQAYAPNPRPRKTALTDAQARLREAEAELQKVEEWALTVQQAVTEYQREAQRLTVLVQTDLPGAVALLRRAAPDSPAGAPARTFDKTVELSVARPRFEPAWKTLSQRWGEARALWALWDDPARARFEARHWTPLEGQVDATRRELESLKQVIRRAQRGVK